MESRRTVDDFERAFEETYKRIDSLGDEIYEMQRELDGLKLKIDDRKADLTEVLRDSGVQMTILNNVLKGDRKLMKMTESYDELKARQTRLERKLSAEHSKAASLMALLEAVTHENVRR